MGKISLGMDRRFCLPLVWSNRQLEKIAPLFHGHVVNVSAWKDEDKEGRHYRDYFVNAASSRLTNWKSEARGFQGSPDEIYLDLEEDLPQELIGRFDVAFNHTTLEHIFNVQKAFKNLCLMSRDVVSCVFPFSSPIIRTTETTGGFPLCVSNAFTG